MVREELAFIASTRASRVSLCPVIRTKRRPDPGYRDYPAFARRSADSVARHSSSFAHCGEISRSRLYAFLGIFFGVVSSGLDRTSEFFFPFKDPDARRNVHRLLGFVKPMSESICSPVTPALKHVFQYVESFYKFYQMTLEIGIKFILITR